MVAICGKWVCMLALYVPPLHLMAMATNGSRPIVLTNSIKTLGFFRRVARTSITISRRSTNRPGRVEVVAVGGRFSSFLHAATVPKFAAVVNKHNQFQMTRLWSRLELLFLLGPVNNSSILNDALTYQHFFVFLDDSGASLTVLMAS